MTAPVAPARAIRNPLDPRNPLAAIYLATMLFELAEGALRFLVPLNLDDRGLGPASIGFVIFAFSATSLLSRGVTAGLFRPDRARQLIIVAGAASTIAYLITPFVTDVAAFTVLMAIDGFGWGVATTSLLAMVMVCTPASISPGVAMGWYIGFQGIAFAIATTVGGLLAQAIGIQPAMLVLATVPVVAASAIAWRMPPVTRDRAAGLDPADAAAVADAADAAADGDDPGPGPALGRRRLGAGVRSMRDHVGTLPVAVWAAALVAVYLNVMNGLLQSLFPLLGLALGLSVAQIGTLSSVRSGVSAVARFVAAWLFARIEPTRLHLPLLTMSAATLALLPSAGGYLLQVPLMALNGVSRGLLRVTTSAAAMEVTPGRLAGTAAAVMTAGLDDGKMLGPLIGGLVATVVGLEAMFRVVPFAFLALYLVLYLGASRRGRAA
ncbi:MAG: MFS transporter [Candidatus Limnocylindria bacterium]